MSKKLLILVSADESNGLRPKKTNLLGPGLAVDFPDPPLAAGDEVAVNGEKWMIASLDQSAAYTPAHGSVLNITATCVLIRETAHEFWSPGKKPAKIEPKLEPFAPDPLADLSPGI